tara:strand:+ start:173 stop:1750 length:1578 start_codon:yes stop_codon:yes gene_type:complete
MISTHNIKTDDLEISISKLKKLYKQKDFNLASNLIKNLLEQYPSNKEILELSIVLLINKKKYTEAINTLRKLINFDPNNYKYFYQISKMYEKIDQLKIAINYLEKTLQINPQNHIAYNQMGICYSKLGKFELAINCFEKAISFKKNDAGYWNNLGNEYKNLEKYNDAIDCYKKAIAIQPSNFHSYNGIGISFYRIRDFYNAEKYFKISISHNNNFAKAYCNLSHVYLMKKNFTKAYEFKEWRFKTSNKEVLNLKPEWKGQENSNILVLQEQGLGDHIRFCSIINELAKNSKQVILECDKRLIPLFQRSFDPNVVFFKNVKKIPQNIKYEYQIYMGSLLSFFRKDVKNFQKTSKGFLKADKNKTIMFSQRLFENDKKIIGISWATNSKDEVASYRNIKLEELLKNITSSNLKFVSLQYGDTTKEIDYVKKKLGIEITNLSELNITYDIDGLSSLICACDSVVTIDNATVHLAGSLGKDTKLILPQNSGTLWSENDKFSYWYQSVQIYRQKKLGDWGTVLKELKNVI